jgi:dihydropteroate synthase
MGEIMKTRVMGILNITPDSFSDGGKFREKAEAIAHAEKMLKDGADIIDVGGESTRPGSNPVSFQEELDRIMPVLEELTTWNVEISVDTSKTDIVKQALEMGVDIINDISGLQYDEGIAALVAKHNARLVIMHMKGIPKTMQENLGKTDIVHDIINFFKQQVGLAVKLGIKEENIILDPGIGFGKSLDDNVKILKEIARFRKLGFPILIGASRKSMVGVICNTDIDQRLAGSLAVACVAAQRGAEIIRVHDVAETVQALKMIDKIW